MKYNLFLHISSSNIVSISFSRQRYKKFRVNEVKEDEFFFAKHKDFLNQFNYRMYITPELQSGYIPLFSLLLLTLNRAYTIEYGPHSICRKERFRPQPPRGVWLDGPGRPNRRLGPSNRPPRAFFPFHPAPSPSGVGSSFLFTRLPIPDLPVLSIIDKCIPCYRKKNLASVWLLYGMLRNTSLRLNLSFFDPSETPFFKWEKSKRLLILRATKKETDVRSVALHQTHLISPKKTLKIKKRRNYMWFNIN